MLFPKSVDQHKPNRPKVPNGLGVLYVLGSVVYLFMLHYLHASKILDIPGALPLAGCVLFGGFLGLFDDWADLRWRYKAFTPILSSLPLIALRIGETKMATYIFGKVDFGIYYYIIIVPLVITVTTNTINQLGGLNGLETICPLIILTGLALVSTDRILLYAPIFVCLLLAILNYRGRIFVGNTGSFALGITIASYAIIANVEQTLLIALIPHLFNSSLILLNLFLFHRTARLIYDGKKLSSNHRRSLQTLIAHNRQMSEPQIVKTISLIVLCFTLLAFLVWLIW